MTAPRHNARIRLAAVSALGLTLALVPFSAHFATGDSIIASAYAKGGRRWRWWRRGQREWQWQWKRQWRCRQQRRPRQCQWP